MIKNIAVVNYGTGNVKSIVAALRKLSFNVNYTDDKSKILAADAIVLPGVGAFKYGMENLNKKGLTDTLKNFAESNRKILGICLGMQLLAEEGHEFGVHKGLGLVDGKVISLKNFVTESVKLSLPHVGWNTIINADSSEYLSIGISENKPLYYFLHSYALETSVKKNVLAYTEYSDIIFPSVIKKNNIIGIQFHPEKSGDIGLNLLKKVLSE